MAEPNLTINQAIERGILYTEFCSGCGKEACRLYFLTTGMEAGSRYCRSCAKEVLNEGYHL